jgi:hypothetical protein
VNQNASIVTCYDQIGKTIAVEVARGQSGRTRQPRRLDRRSERSVAAIRQHHDRACRGNREVHAAVPAEIRRHHRFRTARRKVRRGRTKARPLVLRGLAVSNREREQ